MLSLQGGGGGATSMGFEETEEIGPDGKPHIISEKTFNPTGGKMSKAQMKAQKQMEKEMKVSLNAAMCLYAGSASSCVTTFLVLLQGMAQDMSHLFTNGAFPGGMGQQQKSSNSAQAQKWENDLFKNAMKTFQAENNVVPRKVKGGSQQLSRTPWSQVPTVKRLFPLLFIIENLAMLEIGISDS
jgi:hypothetical protein